MTNTELSKIKWAWWDGLQARIPQTEDIITAIDQFCEQTCVWVANRLDNYITDCGWMYEVFYGYHQLTCPHCGKRVVEQWEPVGERINKDDRK